MRKHHRRLKLLLLSGVLTFGLGAAGAPPPVLAKSPGDAPGERGAATAEAARSASASSRADAAAEGTSAAADAAQADTGAKSAENAGDAGNDAAAATADSTAAAAASTDNAEGEATATASAEASRNADGISATSEAGTATSASVETEEGATGQTRSWSKSIDTKFGSISLSRSMTRMTTEEGTTVTAKSRARAMALATPGVTKADTQTSADVTIRDADVSAGLADSPDEATEPTSSADTAGAQMEGIDTAGFSETMP